MSLVSILMPLRNAEPYIRECIQSIREQQFKDWELVVVNDHSTDQSLDLLTPFALDDPRIRVIDNRGSGIIAALQTGLAACNGTMLTRMDADDIMPPDRLSQMHDALINAKAKSVTTGKVRYFADYSISPGYQRYEDWLNCRCDLEDHWSWVYRECVIASPNWMMRLEEARAFRLFEQLTYPEDYDLVLKWYQQGFEIISLPEVTLSWRDHQHRTSRTSDHYHQSRFFSLKVDHFVQNELQGEHRLMLWGTNDKGKLIARLLEEQKVSFQWMALDPSIYPNGIQGKNIQSFTEVPNDKPIRLILSIFPEEPEMTRLTTYLESLGLTMGRDYWFF